jgi:hypothetical protein
MPSNPQVMPEAVQALWATFPAEIDRHCPVVPPVRSFVHALQPVQALLQHTPSATIPDEHSYVCSAGDPFAFLAAQVPTAVLQ